jgi:hypothetical protein
MFGLRKMVFFPKKRIVFFYIYLFIHYFLWKCVLGVGKKHRERGKKKQDHDKYRSKKIDPENMPRAENSENNFASDQQQIRDFEKLGTKLSTYTEGRQKNRVRV